jgi:hypothetical protein
MPQQPLSSGGGSLVTYPPGYLTTGAKPIITQRPIASLRRAKFIAEDVSNPDRLIRVIDVLENNLEQFARVIAQNPTLGGNLHVGLVFTAGQTQNIAHLLGRAYAGWWIARAQTNTAAFVEAALPAGATAAQVLPVTSANAGIYSLYVF